jgi:hypothetical protein
VEMMEEKSAIIRLGRPNKICTINKQGEKKVIGKDSGK